MLLYISDESTLIYNNGNTMVKHSDHVEVRGYKHAIYGKIVDQMTIFGVNCTECRYIW